MDGVKIFINAKRLLSLIGLIPKSVQQVKRQKKMFCRKKFLSENCSKKAKNI